MHLDPDPDPGPDPGSDPGPGPCVTGGIGSEILMPSWLLGLDGCKVTMFFVASGPGCKVTACVVCGLKGVGFVGKIGLRACWCSRILHILKPSPTRVHRVWHVRVGEVRMHMLFDVAWPGGHYGVGKPAVVRVPAHQEGPPTIPHTCSELLGCGVACGRPLNPNPHYPTIPDGLLSPGVGCGHCLLATWSCRSPVRMGR